MCRIVFGHGNNAISGAWKHGVVLCKNRWTRQGAGHHLSGLHGDRLRAGG